MFKIVWPCDLGDWKRRRKKILSPSSLNASGLFSRGESHEPVICAPVTSQQPWVPSWLHKRLPLGQGAGIQSHSLHGGCRDPAWAQVETVGRWQSAPIPPSLAGTGWLEVRAGVPALARTACCVLALCREQTQP